MKRLIFKKITLQKKFIIFTFTAVIVIMVIIGALVIRRERAIMYKNIERQGRILGETLAIPVLNDLVYEKLGLVEEGGLIDNYVTEIIKRPDIDMIYLAVLDGNGKVVSHNDFSEYGKIYSDPVTLRSLYSDSTSVQKFYSSETGYEALDVATPLSIGKKRWGTLKFALSLESLDREIESVIFHGVIMTLLFLAVGLGLIILLSQRFIRPITELARTMEKAGGESLDVQVAITGEDEIALLGQSFNSMIERIKKSNMKLTQTHNELIQFVGAIEKTGADVLDNKVEIDGCDEISLLCHSFNEMIDRIRVSNLELHKTHEKLLHSQKLASLGTLAAGVAHEINNPLGGMFNCVEMLEQKGGDPEFRKRYLELIKDGLSRVESTVGNLLWMSRKKESTPKSVEINELIKNTYSLNEYLIHKSNVVYKESIEDHVSVVIDPHDLQKVIINLMINAVQSMKNGGVLSVNAFRKNGKVILEVSDTGEGIDEASLGDIFNPFYTTKQPGEGTGLGLWVTHEILENYNAEISVKSKKGEGSKFSIVFNGG